MAITKFKEIRRSKNKRITQDKKTAEREYRLWYADTVDDVESYLAANAPGSIVDAFGDTLELESVDIQADERHEKVYTGVCSYSTAPKPERSEIGDETVSFDLGSQTAKTLVSPQTIAKYGLAGATAPDFQGAIGVNHGKVEGVDIFVEQFSFTVTKIIANADITNSYIQSLRDTAFRWNAIVYRGQAVGEVLYAGASGAPRDAKSYSVAHKFLGSKNLTGITRGGISGITKQGWDYLWTLFNDVDDTAAKFVTPRPLACYVERLYTSANFQTALGLN